MIALSFLGQWSSRFVAMATTGVVAMATWAIYRVARRWSDGRRLETARQRKRDECRRLLSDLETRVKSKLKLQNLNDSDIDRITAMNINQILDELRGRRLSSSTVLTSFQYKALKAHERTNCLVEPVTEAEQWAQNLDSPELAPQGLLHGLPVSIKEYFGMKGYDGSLGLFSLLGKPCQEDSVLVKVLKAQGAVPFVKTNLPHMAMSYTTWNPVFGDTKNPHDTTRGPGGSSGGEAALIALDGSPLGFGSDVGGSIRNPCHFCGLAGLKPTGNRISTKGTFTIDATNNCLPIVLGPMSRDVDTLVIAMKALLVPLMFQLDRAVPPIPFRDEIYNGDRPLRIGYYFDTGLFQPVTSCQRAVKVAKEILEKQGKHTLIKWQLPSDVANDTCALGIRGKLLFADKGETILEVLKGDKANANIADAEALAKMPLILRRAFAVVLRLMDPEMADFVKYSCGAKSMAQWFKVIEEVQKVRYTFDAAWEAAELDVVICPAFSCPAMPNDQLLPHRGEGCDCQVYNVLDVPAGVVPVTKVTADDVSNMADYPEVNEAYRDIKKGMIGAEGLPVGVQVVAPRYQEELCLRVMKEIETGVLNNSYD